MKLFHFAAALLVPLAAVAQQPIDNMAREIALRNPDLAAVKAGYEAQVSETRAANTLAGPEVDFDYKFNAAGGENRWGLSVGQAFDWPGLYRARGKAGAYRADAYRQLYRASLVEKALEAKQALLSLAVAEKQLAVLREADLAMARLSETYEFAFSQGEATVLETSKIKLERFAIANRVAEMEALAESLRATLRALNGGEDIAAVPPLDSHVRLAPLATYREMLEQNDPTVAANAALDLAAGADVSAARASRLPGFKLAYTHDYEDGTHFNGFSVGLSLPSWNFSAPVKAAEALAMAARLSAQDYALRLNAELVGDYTTASRLDARTDAARSTFEGDDYPRLLKKALDAGRINVLDYLREYSSYLDAKASFIDLEGQLVKVLARLDRFNLADVE